MNKRALKQLAARAAWTALQAGLGLITVATLGVPVAYAVPVAWALSAIKSYVASKVGDPDTVTFRKEG
jgi:hypothetical protein